MLIPSAPTRTLGGNTRKGGKLPKLVPRITSREAECKNRSQATSLLSVLVRASPLSDCQVLINLGLSGLSAAIRLKEKNPLLNVTILEARGTIYLQTLL